jgi:acyl carrier protein
MNLFVEAVSRVLETGGELSLDARFREVDGWCSLNGFGLMVLLENDWQAPVTVEEFLRLRTVRDLYRVAFIAFAAKTLSVPRSHLTGESAFGDFPEWDSVAHLRLVMEAEARFGVRYPLERIPDLTTLDDFLV